MYNTTSSYPLAIPPAGRTWLFVLALALQAFSATAQISDRDVMRIVGRRKVTQDDAIIALMSNIPDWYKAGQTDTIQAAITNYKKTYRSEYLVLYYEIIQSIKERNFREVMPNLTFMAETRRHKYSMEEFYEYNIINYLIVYYGLGNTSQFRSDEMKQLRAAAGKYLAFLKELAESQLETPGLRPEERWLVMYLANPRMELFTELEKPTYRGTGLQQGWKIYQRNLGLINGANAAIMGGAFVPVGNNSVLGTHPSFGLALGIRQRRLMLDLNASVRLLRTPQTYTVIATDNYSHTTDYYRGIYAGLDAGYQLWQRKKKEIDLLAGIAWDGFNALQGQDATNNNGTGINDEATKVIGSFNFNFGLGYRYYLGSVLRNGRLHKRYLALQVKYNLLNYVNKGGTNLDGNAYTVNLIFGGFHGRYAGQGLRHRRMRY